MNENDDRPAFVDTNVLVYAFDRSENNRRKLAGDLIERLAATERLRLSTQVLQEFFVTITRKIAKPIATSQALQLIDDFSCWPVFTIDVDAIRSAGLLAGKDNLSFWDALIVVAATRSDAAMLYSEDLAHGQKIAGIEVINPFA